MSGADAVVRRAERAESRIESPRAGVLTLVTGPAVLPAQFLSREAWQAIERAEVVLGPASDRTVGAVLEAGIDVTVVEPSSAADLAERLLNLAAEDRVVWIASPPVSPGLVEELAGRAARQLGGPHSDHLIGAWDPRGARVLELVEVMDRLCSPGGCSWDRAQTQSSLVPYLIEETYELVEAIEAGEVADVIEELGDVLMQVVFHARLAEEAAQPFDLDEVAGAICDKLRGRQPQIFDAQWGATGQQGGWEAHKQREKAARISVLDGIPDAMPSIDQAVKVARRLQDRGLLYVLDDAVAQLSAQPSQVGGDLLRLVRAAVVAGVDPARELRKALRVVRSQASRIDAVPAHGETATARAGRVEGRAPR